MARKKINNELWRAVQPLLPTVERSSKGGRPRVDDRAALNGILFVLQTGIAWEDLPQEPAGLRQRHDLLASPS